MLRFLTSLTLLSLLPVHSGVDVLSSDTGVDASSSVSLLQVGASIQTKTKFNPMRDAEYFGSFSQEESTWTYDGTLAGRKVDPEITVLDGWNPQQRDPFYQRGGANAEFFHESKSGGYKEAWQSFYPALSTSVAGNDVHTGKWFTGTGGVWQQNYVNPSSNTAGVPHASWFDASVNQVDGFGRMKFPGYGSPRSKVFWQEKSSNTTLTCNKPGCVANVSLLAPFDWNNEDASDCKMSVFFHPTDFDDHHHHEQVEWVLVNNQQVSTSCRPRTQGCNKTAQRPLLPCVYNIPIDHMMPDNGVFTVSAKISTAVDECPYKGNYLSAVPMITCLVRNKPSKKSVLVEESVIMNCSHQTLLQCADMNCSVEVNARTCLPHGGDLSTQKCKLSVSVKQTDFDGQDGTAELIDYIKVNEQEVKNNIAPGKNPCKSADKGTPLQPSELDFMAIKDFNLVNISSKVNVQAKISEFVDECDLQGFLLDGLVTVSCTARVPLVHLDDDSVAALIQRQTRTQTRPKDPSRMLSRQRQLRGHGVAEDLLSS